MAKKPYYRTFLTIWGGQAISLLTSAIVQYAIIWDLTARTGSAGILSMAAMVGLLPTALFSPFIGTLVDRWNRKTIMIVADAGIALATLGLAVFALMDTLPVWAVMVALFIRAVGSAFHSPCLDAVLPQLVPEEDLTRMNGYTATLRSVSYIASPALAAALYAWMSLGNILLLDVLGAVVGVATVAISKIPRLETKPETEKIHVLREVMDGLRMLRKHNGLFWMVVICSAFSVFFIPIGSLFPLMTMQYFGGTTTDAGIVEVLFAVGMFLGGLILGVWGGTKNRMVIMVAAIFVLGASIMLCGLVPPTAFWLFVVLSGIAGFSSPFFNSPFMAIIQTKIPPEFLGRILGVISSMMTLASPLGLMLSGLIADRVGIQNWFAICGLLCALCALPCLAIRSVRELDKPEPEALPPSAEG